MRLALHDRNQVRVFCFCRDLTNDSLETKGSIIDIHRMNNRIYIPGARMSRSQDRQSPLPHLSPPPLES